MKKILFIFLLVFPFIANAKIVLPSLITDGMVLQQNAEARLWGDATPNTTVTITTSWGKKTTAKTDDAGHWLTTMETPVASYDVQSITIAEARGEKRELHDVLIGEVWLASGQSNMEMPLKGFPGCCVKDGTQDAMRAMQESPYVRMFNVEKAQAFTKQTACRGKWMKPTFENALEFSATAYYFASSLSNALQIPVGIVNASYGGTHVESWTSAEVCQQYPDIPQDSVSVYDKVEWEYERPLVTYNAMFYPIKNYTYKGIVWYQGCGNVGNNTVYAERLKNMVALWRNELALGEIPFYQVQIAPYIYGKDENAIEGALLREQQDKARLMIANSDIVCINDLVEPIECYNIHPRQKRMVGLRLALLALNKTYGKTDIACSGPRYKEGSLRINGDTATVGFTTNNFGICRNWGLQGFEIAGEDRVFYPATAEFHWQTNEVYLTSGSVSHPVAVRYCFKDFLIGNLIGGNELPLFPFRTDNW